MRLLSSMATRRLLADLIDQARAAGLGDVDVESVGGVDAARRVADGESVDVVVLAGDAMQRLADAGHVDASSLVTVVISDVAVATASGSSVPAEPVSTPAFPDAAALRAALGSAERIGYSTGPSGTALRSLIDGWGMSAAIGDRLVQARPGVPVARLLVDGEVDLGFQQTSELIGEPGVRILGTMPDECAIVTEFVAAVATVCEDAAAARDVVAYLGRRDTAQTKRAHGFSPPE